MMPKPPKEFCVDSFEYFEYGGTNDWSEPVYEKPITIKDCRIDRGTEYSSTTSGRQLLYNAVIFCYEGITSPLPEFKTQSMIRFDDKDYTVLKVMPIYEAYDKVLYSYELEVV